VLLTTAAFTSGPLVGVVALAGEVTKLPTSFGDHGLAVLEPNHEIVLPPTAAFGSDRAKVV
jgi:hypothetical protein